MLLCCWSSTGQVDSHICRKAASCKCKIEDVSQARTLGLGSAGNIEDCSQGKPVLQCTVSGISLLSNGSLQSSPNCLAIVVVPAYPAFGRGQVNEYTHTHIL